FIQIQATTIAVMNLRSHRTALGLSQSRLARLSHVSRFKICTCELGDGSFTPEEWSRICEALQAEVDRLRSIPTQIELGDSQLAAMPLAAGRSGRACHEAE